jgi:hypothetical protein
MFVISISMSIFGTCGKDKAEVIQCLTLKKIIKQKSHCKKQKCACNLVMCQCKQQMRV